MSIRKYEINEINEIKKPANEPDEESAVSKWPKKIKINKTNVESLPFPESGQQFCRDAELPGFGLRLTANSKSYICEYWLGGKDKSVRVTLGKHGKITADQARTEAKKLLGVAAHGKDANEEKRKAKADQTTLWEVWQQYKEVRKLRPKTIQVYESALKRGLGDWLDRPIARITRPMLKERQRELGRMVGKRSNKEGATENANQVMRVLRSMMLFARDEYITADKQDLRLPEGFASSFPKSFKKNRRHRRVEDGDLARWYRAVSEIQNESIKGMLLLCLFSGLRRGEASKLTWDKVNLPDKFIQLQAEDTKNNEPHRVYLSDFMLELLTARHKLKGENRYVFPGAKPDTPIGEPKAQLTKIKSKTGIEFSTHDLRRTYVSIAESVEAPYAISKLLINHKGGTDITESYMTVSPDKLRLYQQRITDRLKELIAREEESSESQVTGND